MSGTPLERAIAHMQSAIATQTKPDDLANIELFLMGYPVPLDGQQVDATRALRNPYYDRVPTTITNAALSIAEAEGATHTERRQSMDRAASFAARRRIDLSRKERT